jgi:hypothetical protein
MKKLLLFSVLFSVVTYADESKESGSTSEIKTIEALNAQADELLTKTDNDGSCPECMKSLKKNLHTLALHTIEWVSLCEYANDQSSKNCNGINRKAASNYIKDLISFQAAANAFNACDNATNRQECIDAIQTTLLQVTENMEKSPFFVAAKLQQ